MEIRYQVIRSARKTVALQITPTGEVVVRCPRRMPAREIEQLIRSREAWIEKHLARLTPAQMLPPFTAQELRELADRALQDIPPRAERFAPPVGVSFSRITIRNQRTRWGSCSSKGNLNFNCLLMLTPPEIRDYVVVHELCHLKEMNHSPAFWAQVERILPDYRERRKWLKEHGASLIARLP